ncbi:MAG: hypothetical protein ACPKQO_10750 [Nitrososphaeraceae archaeon]
MNTIKIGIKISIYNDKDLEYMNIVLIVRENKIKTINVVNKLYKKDNNSTSKMIYIIFILKTEIGIICTSYMFLGYKTYD